MVSTLFGALTAAAARAGGQLPPLAPGKPDVLLVANNAPIPEVACPVHRTPAGRALAGRWDRVVDLNAAICPAHPGGWKVDGSVRPILARAWREAWGLGAGRLSLVVDSIQAPPAATLVRIFADAEITVLSEGLMSYGPTRTPQPPMVAGRLESLVHLDLLPGLRPVLLGEHGIEQRPVPLEAFRATLAEVACAYAGEVAALRAELGLGGSLAGSVADDAGTQPGKARRVGLVLGQYLGALGLISPEREARLQLEMIELAAARGADVVVFKAHPTAPPADVRRIAERSAAEGAELVVSRGSLPAEVLAGAVPICVAVSCFSTSLVTLRGLHGTPIASVGTAEMMERLTPFENSNRVPLVVADALTRGGAEPAPGVTLQDLIETVAYRMQPVTAQRLRPVAARTLAALPKAEALRYVGVERMSQIRRPRGPRVAPFPLWVKELAVKAAPRLADRAAAMLAKRLAGR
jgi:hypothetical protein